MDDPLAEGVRIHTELRGADRAAAMRAMADSGAFGAPIATLSFEFVFGRVWAREGLDRKQRSLVTIGVLVALGQIAELKNHVRVARTNGLTPREIEEAFDPDGTLRWLSGGMVRDQRRVGNTA